MVSRSPAVTAAVNGYIFQGAGKTLLPDFGSAAGYPSANTPFAINDNGQVVGVASTSSSTRGAPYIYQGGTLRNLSSSLGQAVPTGISSTGTIVGGRTQSPGGPGLFEAFSYDTSLHLLGFPTGTSDSYAFAVNKNGTAVGLAGTVGTTISSVALDYDGSFQSLGTVPGTSDAIATSVNTAGNVAGWSGNISSSSAKPTSAQQLAFMGDGAAGLILQMVTGLAGQQLTGDAYMFNASTGKMIDLGTLGGTFGAASSINDSNQIVGMSTTASGAYHAFLYDGTSMIDLNSLLPAGSGWTLVNATGINNNGDIVGLGLYNGTYEGFVLTPAPEPTGLALLSLSAVIGLSLTRRRWHV